MSLPDASSGGASRPCARSWGSYLAGWKAYFRIAETPRVLADIDKWMRHRLRALQLKHWKRGPTIYRELRARGMSDRRCQPGRCQRPPVVAQLGDGRPYRAAERALRRAGSSPACRVTSTHRTARCGPACRVVWQGTRRLKPSRPYAVCGVLHLRPHLSPRPCGYGMIGLASGHGAGANSWVSVSAYEPRVAVRSAWRGWPLDRRSAIVGSGSRRVGRLKPIHLPEVSGFRTPLSTSLSQTLERETAAGPKALR